MKFLQKMQMETLAQMLTSESIAESLSGPFMQKVKKVGLASVLAVTAFFSSGIAHADDATRGVAAATALGAILVDGARPNNIPEDCNTRGISGYKVAAGGIAGGVLGNQIGGGDGKKIATAAIALIGANAVANKEAYRVQQECLRQQRMEAQRMARQGYGAPQGYVQGYQPVYQNGGYQNGGYQNGGYQNGAYPVYNGRQPVYQQPVYQQPAPQVVYTQPQPVGVPVGVPINQMGNMGNVAVNPAIYANNRGQPVEDVLYVIGTPGRSAYVTAQNSPGLAALSGSTVGERPLESDGLVAKAMESSYMNFNVSYARLQDAANKYLTVVNGNTTGGKLERYAVTAQERQASAGMIAENQRNIQQAMAELTQAYTNYGDARGRFANIADNAAEDGFNIASYNKSLSLFQPPESVNIAYRGQLPSRPAQIVTSQRR